MEIGETTIFERYVSISVAFCHNVYSFSEGDWDFGTVKYRETAMKINRFAEKNA